MHLRESGVVVLATGVHLDEALIASAVLDANVRLDVVAVVLVHRINVLHIHLVCLRTTSPVTNDIQITHGSAVLRRHRSVALDKSEAV